jgi:hypothetical protein
MMKFPLSELRPQAALSLQPMPNGAVGKLRDVR